MGVKAIGFDIGHTLIQYNNPLNWASLYPEALNRVFEECKFPCSDAKVSSAISILTKYNTRVTYRETEVCADVIFAEILDAWHLDHSFLENAKRSFFSFFQQDAQTFDEVETVLSLLKSRGLKTGVLTDVAYGMDNRYALSDIAGIQPYFDVVLTSVDTGFRKPHKAGFEKLLNELDVRPTEMLFVGDEQKDIVGANNIGICSVLVNRDNQPLEFGQNYTVSSLETLIKIVGL